MKMLLALLCLIGGMAEAALVRFQSPGYDNACTVRGTVTVTGTSTPATGSTWYIQSRWSELSVSVTGAADAAVTLTLPSASGLFHYVTHIEILKYVTAAITASATPIIITTTNLPGAMDFSLRRAGGVADIEPILYQMGASPVRSSAVTTATTIVFPAVTGVKWIARVIYYTAP